MNEQHPTQGLHPENSPAPPADAAPLSTPERIGRYLVRSILGEGAFGLVYLAHDEQLDRPVAIKVPRRKLLGSLRDAGAYLNEARTVGRLDHQNIVPVYDVGSTEEFPCFIVSRFIEGSTLASTCQNRRFSFQEAAQLVATIAEALHYAHSKGLVHRDVKPGNILLDTAGKPYVADFGLALKEENVGKGPTLAGTPAYMSPEQARGEGHRVDGRSDIFSLGIVLYELLTGKRPFRAETQDELLEQITVLDPRPPRQVDDRLPKELERICLKAIAKRASERYTTAKDMAEDMREFLSEQSGDLPFAPASRVSGPAWERPGAAPPVTAGPALQETQASAPPSSTATGSAPGSSVSGSQGVVIVPKGLRSFDAHDADFFLELLPGARDRDGLPDSLRFWKRRIEETDPDQTFSVGLIYGPSGCGKSSLVKAGLLPRLSGDVLAVYVEATATETESRLANGLRKRCPALSADLGLKETLALLRRGQGAPAGKKVLIVLDQFEQWLHAHKEVENAELVQALRQCDGARVQCLLMVRDDFWMAATRFMRELEIRLVEGQNSAAVDLFPLRHAEKVLAAFGRAFGVLADAADKERKQFLHQAVAGLSQEGKVNCVRLALFAEMMKGKPWTVAALRAVGGAQGVGLTFLEETFSSASAPPDHRYHQKAARAVLRALLPESGTDIKGHMRSQAELLEASGYGSHPKDFEDLIHILDSQIRLITPTDPEGVDDDARAERENGNKEQGEKSRYYQLTHDYLVPSLQEWLTAKQKETRRGRAELLLAERAADWMARPESRQLPSLLQWLRIRWLTRKKNWTEPQRKMMWRAARHHGLRLAVLAVFLLALAWIGWEFLGRLKAQTLRDRLLEATTADVPGIVKEIAPYRGWVDPLLRPALAEAQAQGDARKQLHASLALLSVDPGQIEYLYGRLLKGEPQEAIVIRQALFERHPDLKERWWTHLENTRNDQDERFHAACALARFDPDHSRWEKVSGDVAATLIIQKPFTVAQWTAAFQPVGKHLLPPLADLIEDEKRSGADLGLIASVYGAYSSSLPDGFARLEKRLTQQPDPGASSDAKISLAKRQANIGLALLLMGRSEQVWPLLKFQPDPTLRNLVIERMGPAGVNSRVLTARLEQEKDAAIRRAILLGLGEFGPERLTHAERHNLLPRLLELYRDDPDAGVHSAADWLLRQWQADDQRKEIDQSLVAAQFEGQRHWYRNRHGLTMVIVPRPGEFWMGDGSERRKMRIDRNFAIASREVTVEQFRALVKRDPADKRDSPTPDCPATRVSWYDAVEYCSLLSKQENLPESEWCYLPNKEGKYDDGMKMAPNYLQRKGYRLPTEAEWEFACRASTTTMFSFGQPEELADRYAWHLRTARGRSHPVGSLKPNDLGLFDMHGNAYEWCQGKPRPTAEPKNATEDREDAQDSKEITEKEKRVLRGGAFSSQVVDLRSALDYSEAPWFRGPNVGFRVARTAAE